jgi:hypothetical protein
MAYTAKIDFITELRLAGLPAPEREWMFHPDRKWRFDYAWPKAMVALEVEGGIFGNGQKCPVCKQSKRLGHTSVSGMLDDMQKYREAVLLGWKLIRVTPAEEKDGTAFRLVEKLLR